MIWDSRGVRHTSHVIFLGLDLRAEVDTVVRIQSSLRALFVVCKAASVGVMVYAVDAIDAIGAI